MSRVGTTLPTGIDVRRPRDHHQPPLFTLNLIHQGISGEAGIYLVLHALAFCAVMPDDDFTILISCACTTRIWLLFLRYTPKRNALRGFGGDGATDHVPESGTRNGFNPLPTLVPSDGTRIYGTVASSPRAVTDRPAPRLCVGTVRIYTNYTKPLSNHRVRDWMRVWSLTAPTVPSELLSPGCSKYEEPVFQPEKPEQLMQSVDHATSDEPTWT